MLVIVIAPLVLVLLRSEPRITFQSGGARVDSILASVSVQARERLISTGEVRSDILIIRADQVPLSALMARIADAEDSQWERSGNGWKLARSARTENQEIANELAARTAALAKDLDQQSAAAIQTGSQQNTSSTGPQTFNPSFRLAWRLLQSVGPSALSELGSGVRVVYAEQPNSAQRALPESAAAAIGLYKAELARLPKPESIVSGSRLLFAVWHNMFEGYVGDLKVLGPDGARAQESRAALVPSDLTALLVDPSPADPKDGPLALQPDAQAFAQIGQAATQNRPVLIPPEVKTKLLHPERNDPVSFLMAPIIASVAGPRSFVASVPDFSFVTSLIFSAKPLTRNSIRRWLAVQCDLDESHEGWLVLRPRFPVEIRELHIDRDALGSFYRRAYQNGGTTLGDLSAFVEQSPRRFFESLGIFYAFFIMPELARMIEPASLAALRVYGSLSERQRSALLAGRPVMLLEMSAAAKQELADWIYNSEATGFGRHQGGPDVTDVFPNGLPLDGGLDGTVSAREEVIPLYDGKENLNGSAMDSSSLGAELAREDVGESQMHARITAYRLGKTLKLNLQFRTKDYETSAMLSETTFDRKLAPLRFDQLPESFRKTSNQYRKQFLQEFAHPTGGTTKKIPPP